jgi:hypothetical protein
MEQSILEEFMRQIDTREADLVAFLAKVGNVQLSLSPTQRVWVVNPAMGSIRADYCTIGCRVLPAGSHIFEDEDKISIVGTLFLTKDGRFGELDFWKVNDEAIIRPPTAPL